MVNNDTALASVIHLFAEKLIHETTERPDPAMFKG